MRWTSEAEQLSGTFKNEKAAIGRISGRIIHLLRHRFNRTGDLAKTNRAQRLSPLYRSGPSLFGPRHRELPGTTGDGFIIIDEHGTICSVNMAAETLFAFDSNQLVGGSIEDLLAVPESHGPERRRDDGENWNQVETPGVCHGVQGRRMDGSVFPLELEVVALPPDAGQLLLVVVRDITDWIQTRDRRRHAQRLEMIGKLTIGIVHDFNNILASISLNMDLLRDETGPGGRDRAIVEQTSISVAQAKSLAMRLLSLSREQPWSPKAWDVSDLIIGLESLLRRTLGNTVEVVIELGEDLWPVMVDAPQLENALLNLAINARDAMPEGGVLRIEAVNITMGESRSQARKDLTPGDYVRLAVCDTGIGMPPEVREKVLEPFFTTKSAGEGSGLGLFMVHDFVRQSKGHLTIESKVGIGTMVTLFLPRAN